MIKTRNPFLMTKSEENDFRVPSKELLGNQAQRLTKHLDSFKTILKSLKNVFAEESGRLAEFTFPLRYYL